MHGSLNVPIEHHPTIRYIVYNGYYKVISNIPKMGHLPTPVVANLPAPASILQVDGHEVGDRIKDRACQAVGFVGLLVAKKRHQSL